MTSSALPDDLLTLSEASAHLGLDVSRLRRLAARGVLPARKVGSAWVTTLRDLDAFAHIERPRGWPRGRPRGRSDDDAPA